MPLIFLDIEAASFSGWPIEIGLSTLAGSKVETWSSLIRPRADWPESDWDPKAARVHGIARKKLDTAPIAASVAREVIARIEGHSLVSDAPEFDGRWLAQLLGHAVPLLDFGNEAARHFDAEAEGMVHATLATLARPHRAGPDAQALSRAWMAGVHSGMRTKGLPSLN